MILGITLDIDGKEQKLSLDNARALYGELSKLFGNTSMHGGTVNSMPSRGPKNTEHVNHKPEQAKAKSEPKPTLDKYANPKVEAARDRAAARTSGCGARR